jgi:hypothetical protein
MEALAALFTEREYVDEPQACNHLLGADVALIGEIEAGRRTVKVRSLIHAVLMKQHWFRDIEIMLEKE